MMKVKLLSKKKAKERMEYVKSLNYSDADYVRHMRRHMLKHRQNANGLLNAKIPAEEELFFFESYGFKNLKNYAIDVLMQNIEYCEVLELDSHDKQIEKTIEFLEKTKNMNYLLSLKPFSTKNDKTWYIPVDRLINWIDSFMIQRQMFFDYSTGKKSYLYVPNYFTDNVLLMTVKTDNDDENYNDDIDEIMDVYTKLVEGINEILRQLPEDKLIDDFFMMSDEKLKENEKNIRNLATEYMEFIKKELE